MIRTCRFATTNITKINSYNMSARVFTPNTDGKLNGKVAIVTASTEGIGYAIAQRLGKEGASIVISSRKENNVLNAVKSLRSEGINVEGVVCHVGNYEQRQKLFDIANNKFGGLDILVSNAAVNPAVSPILERDIWDHLKVEEDLGVNVRIISDNSKSRIIHKNRTKKYVKSIFFKGGIPIISGETEEKIWDKIFEINVKCSWLLAKEAYPQLIKRGGGSIVFISSIAGYQPMEPLGPYSVSKTTLIGLTKAIANEVVHENIRVNCVAPGIVATKFASAITSSEAGKEKSLSIVPMKRFGKTSEIAGAVAFLASEDASYITGETLVVAGGAFAHL